MLANFFFIFNGPKPLAVPDSNVPQNIYRATPRTAGSWGKGTLCGGGGGGVGTERVKDAGSKFDDYSI